MGRVTVYVPDELLDSVRAELPDLNMSAALQDGLRRLRSCEHDELTCSACGLNLERHSIVGPALGRFFTALSRRYAERISMQGYEGAARILHQVAADHGVPGVAATALPRPSRRQIARRHEVVELPLEADSRRRHPTAQEATA